MQRESTQRDIWHTGSIQGFEKDVMTGNIELFGRFECACVKGMVFVFGDACTELANQINMCCAAQCACDAGQISKTLERSGIRSRAAVVEQHHRNSRIHSAESRATEGNALHGSEWVIELFVHLPVIDSFKQFLEVGRVNG